MQIKKYLIPIVITLLVLVASVEGIYIFTNKNVKETSKKCDDKIKYVGTKFLKENIEPNVPKEVEIKAHNINNDNSLLLELTSTRNILKSSVLIEYYDSENNLIKNEEINVGLIPKNRPYIILATYPTLNIGTYSGKIKVSMEPEYDDDLNYLDEKLLNLTTNATKDDISKETTITMSGNNPYENATLLAGYIVLYKNGVVIESQYVTADLKSENINLSGVFHPISNNGTMDFVDYDDAKLVVNTLF